MIKTPMLIRDVSTFKPHSVTPLFLIQIPATRNGIENKNVMKLMIPSRLLLRWNDIVEAEALLSVWMGGKFERKMGKKMLEGSECGGKKWRPAWV